MRRSGGGDDCDWTQAAIAHVLAQGVWKAQLDPATGQTYYYHVDPKHLPRTTWNLVKELGLQPPNEIGLLDGQENGEGDNIPVGATQVPAADNKKQHNKEKCGATRFRPSSYASKSQVDMAKAMTVVWNFAQEFERRQKEYKKSCTKEAFPCPPGWKFAVYSRAEDTLAIRYSNQLSITFGAMMEVTSGAASSALATSVLSFCEDYGTAAGCPRGRACRGIHDLPATATSPQPTFASSSSTTPIIPGIGGDDMLLEEDEDGLFVLVPKGRTDSRLTRGGDTPALGGTRSGDWEECGGNQQRGKRDRSPRQGRIEIVPSTATTVLPPPTQITRPPAKSPVPLPTLDKIASATGGEIALTVSTPSGEFLTFFIDRGAPLEQLMESYCQTVGVKRDLLEFYYENNELPRSETATGLGMVEWDLVDVAAAGKAPVVKGAPAPVVVSGSTNVIVAPTTTMLQTTNPNPNPNPPPPPCSRLPSHCPVSSSTSRTAVSLTGATPQRTSFRPATGQILPPRSTAPPRRYGEVGPSRSQPQQVPPLSIVHNSHPHLESLSSRSPPIVTTIPVDRSPLPRDKVIVCDTSFLLKFAEPSTFLDTLTSRRNLIVIPDAVHCELDAKTKDRRNRRIQIIALEVNRWIEGVIKREQHLNRRSVHKQSAAEVEEAALLAKLPPYRRKADDWILACALWAIRADRFKEEGKSGVLLATEDRNLNTTAMGEGVETLKLQYMGMR